jgi:lambda family phage minor tail protein L
MTIEQDVRSSWHDAIVELFELDASMITKNANDVFYFTSDIFPDGTKIIWKGQTYEPFPITATGFETTTKGTIPQPELTVANVLGTLAPITSDYDDLIGAKIVRRRTLGKYLDNGKSPNNLEEFPSDTYFIERKTSETSLSITWQLSNKIDLEGLQLPRRVITQNYCLWKYRSSECSYVGPPIADDRDRAITGDGSGGSQNFINASNALQAAKIRQRQVQSSLNLAKGRVLSNCEPTNLPILILYESLVPPHSFSIVVSGQPLFGIVEGNVVDVTSSSAAYRPGNTLSTDQMIKEVIQQGDNVFGPIYQIDLFASGVATSGNPDPSLVNTKSYYSESFPVSYAFPIVDPNLPGGNKNNLPLFAIVSGQTVSLVTSGVGYRRGPQKKELIRGIFGIDAIDFSGTTCAESRAAVSGLTVDLATANSSLASAQSAYNAALAALPSGSTVFDQDVCGKRLNSCRLRFGTNLPFGAFPGANLSR